MLAKIWMFMTLVGMMMFLTLDAQARKTEKAIKALDYPNSSKQLVANRINISKDKNRALVYSIQAIDQNGRRYSLQDDYHERKFICEQFGFGEPDSTAQSITSTEDGGQVLKIGNDGEKLVRLKRGERVTMLDMVPCQIASDSVPRSFF